MLRFLDPRFRLVAALIDDPTCSTKVRDVALQQAETIATQCGFTFEGALQQAGVKLGPDVTLPYVAHPTPVDNPITDEESLTVSTWPSASAAEELDDDGVGNLDVIGEPSDCTDGVVTCRPGGDNSDDAEPGGQIRAALRADPGRSDRDIARECGASPTTIGKVRRALGLTKTVRSVVRGGVAYDMQVGERS